MILIVTLFMTALQLWYAQNVCRHVLLHHAHLRQFSQMSLKPTCYTLFLSSVKLSLCRDIIVLVFSTMSLQASWILSLFSIDQSCSLITFLLTQLKYLVQQPQIPVVISYQFLGRRPSELPIWKRKAKPSVSPSSDRVGGGRHLMAGVPAIPPMDTKMKHSSPC